MSRINTNIPSLVARQQLAVSNEGLDRNLERLSTGLRINRAADDPSGLVTSQALLGEAGGVRQALENAERATNVLATADTAMSEVSGLLVSIQSLVVASANEAGLSREEIEANQLQIDGAVESITRIARTTSFGGLKLLDGSLDYVTSSVPASAITSVQVHAARFGRDPFVPVAIEVVGSAQQAGLFASAGGPTIPSGLTLEIAGNEGPATFDFGSGTSLSSIASALNNQTEMTGVSAALSGGVLRFDSVAFGDEAFVSVRPIPDSTGSFFQTFDAAGTATDRDLGQDVVALVNGALAVGRGTDLRFDSPDLKLDLKLDPAYAQTTGSLREFQITDGGTVFQLGSEADFEQQVALGIRGMTASRLGDETIGFLESITTGGDRSLLSGRFIEAFEVVAEAIDQVSTVRGRLGAFEAQTLESSARSLGIALENLSAGASKIRDTDFAAETAALTRSQILISAGESALAIANSSAASVLSLLR
ncbi:MAG: flagellin [Phycisphaeraceae bacterium]|nr:flagellin [Phycisphaeraceae bacterium]